MKIVILSYVIAFIIGCFFFIVLPFNDYLNILIADVIMTMVIWIFSVMYKNSSIYDPYWSFIPLVYILAYTIYKQAFDVEIILLNIAVFLWGIRLTGNWIFTFKGLSTQDWRYDKFKRMKGWFWSNLFGIHLMPTLLVYGVMYNALVMVNHHQMGVLSIAGFIVCIIGISFEFLADETLHKFRSTHQNMICREGIWNISRHPNYLGEIIFWFGIYFMMLQGNYHLWYLIIFPILITLLFVCISIPMMEKRIKHKAGFMEYINEVSMLWPYKKGLTKDK